MRMTPWCTRESNDEADSDFGHSSEVGEERQALPCQNNSATPKMSHPALCVMQCGRSNPNPRQSLRTHSPVSCPTASRQAELWCSEQRQSACRFSTALHPAAPAHTSRENKRFERDLWRITADSRKPSFLITVVSGEEGGKKSGFRSLYLSYLWPKRLFSLEIWSPRTL